MRLAVHVTLIALSIVLTFASLQAEDLTRWIRVAQAPTPPENGEPIQTPRREPLDCPSLKELGYKTKTLANLKLDISIANARLPADCSDGLFDKTAVGQDGRSWFETEFNWAASDLYAQPAYFDDPMLERYGQTRHPLVQPWISGAHFFSQFPLMPYKIVVDRPYDTIYTLGYYRPGSPTPCVARRLPRP